MYSMPKNRDQFTVLHQWMHVYQDLYGHPPTLGDIQRAHIYEWRSSARYALERLLELGLVELYMPAQHHRRYKAI
jgi:hypothetical protein